MQFTPLDDFLRELGLSVSQLTVLYAEAADGLQGWGLDRGGVLNTIKSMFARGITPSLARRRMYEAFHIHLTRTDKLELLPTWRELYDKYVPDTGREIIKNEKKKRLYFFCVAGSPFFDLSVLVSELQRVVVIPETQFNRKVQYFEEAQGNLDSLTPEIRAAAHQLIRDSFSLSEVTKARDWIEAFDKEFPTSESMELERVVEEIGFPDSQPTQAQGFRFEGLTVPDKVLTAVLSHYGRRRLEALIDLNREVPHLSVEAHVEELTWRPV